MQMRRTSERRPSHVGHSAASTPPESLGRVLGNAHVLGPIRSSGIGGGRSRRPVPQPLQLGQARRPLAAIGKSTLTEFSDAALPFFDGSKDSVQTDGVDADDDDDDDDEDGDRDADEADGGLVRDLGQASRHLNKSVGNVAGAGNRTGQLRRRERRVVPIARQKSRNRRILPSHLPTSGAMKIDISEPKLSSDNASNQEQAPPPPLQSPTPSMRLLPGQYQAYSTKAHRRISVPPRSPSLPKRPVGLELGSRLRRGRSWPSEAPTNTFFDWASASGVSSEDGGDDVFRTSSGSVAKEAVRLTEKQQEIFNANTRRSGDNVDSKDDTMAIRRRLQSTSLPSFSSLSQGLLPLVTEDEAAESAAEEEYSQSAAASPMFGRHTLVPERRGVPVGSGIISKPIRRLGLGESRTHESAMARVRTSLSTSKPGSPLAMPPPRKRGRASHQPHGSSALRHDISPPKWSSGDEHPSEDDPNFNWRMYAKLQSLSTSSLPALADIDEPPSPHPEGMIGASEETGN